MQLPLTAITAGTTIIIMPIITGMLKGGITGVITAKIVKYRIMGLVRFQH